MVHILKEKNINYCLPHIQVFLWTQKCQNLGQLVIWNLGSVSFNMNPFNLEFRAKISGQV